VLKGGGGRGGPDRVQSDHPGEAAGVGAAPDRRQYGVPATICDLLFAQYVAGKSGRGRSSSGGELDDRPDKRQRRQCVVQDVASSKEEFFRVLDKDALDKDFIRFSHNMLGGEFTSQVLFMRPCYTELLAQVLKIVDDPGLPSTTRQS
jgi:hypothetical protein